MKRLLTFFLSVFAFNMVIAGDGISIRSGNGHGTNTLLYDAAFKLTIDPNGRKLYDIGGTISSFDWDARVGYDTVGVFSFGWGSRTLRDSLNAASMDWDARTFTGTAWRFLSITNHTDISSGAFASGNVWGYDGITGRWTNGPPATFGSGSVTSVGQTVPVQFKVTGSPVTGSGTLAITLTNATGTSNSPIVLQSNAVVNLMTLNDLTTASNLLANAVSVVNAAAPPWNAGIGGDDTAKIQAALNYASNKNAVVFLPANTQTYYVIAGSLVMPEYTSLMGEASTLTSVGTRLYSGGGVGPIIAMNGSGNKLSHFQIFGDAISDGCTGIRSTTNATATTEWKIEDVEIKKMRYGMILHTAWDGEFISCAFRNNGEGLVISNNVNAITLFATKFDGNVTNSIRIQGAVGQSVNEININGVIENTLRGVFLTNEVAVVNLNGIYFENATNSVYADGGSTERIEAVNIYGGNHINGKTNIIARHTDSLNIFGNNFASASIPAWDIDSTVNELNNWGNRFATGVTKTTAGVHSYSVSTNVTLIGGQFVGDGGGLTNVTTTPITFKINSGGSTTISPTYLDWNVIPYNCTIDHVTMVASPSGSAVVEVMTCTTNVFDGGITHPVAADKITASAPPTLTTAFVSQDGTLTGWNRALTNNQVIAFQVTSATTVTNLVVSLHVTKTQ